MSLVAAGRIAERYRSSDASRGFSIIELMVALVLGLLLIEGILVLFTSTDRIGKRQAAMAALQENGRAALAAVGNDLRQIRRLPCGGRVPPSVFAARLASHLYGSPAGAMAPPTAVEGEPYDLPPHILLSGAKCVADACRPAPDAGLQLPEVGLSSGNRVPGTDVLTIRYLDGDGWPVNSGGFSCDRDGGLAAFSIGAPPPGFSRFDQSHLAFLGSCSASDIFRVRVDGQFVEPIRESQGVPACNAIDAQTRLFDLDRQMMTTVYYLQLKPDPNRSGRQISVLMKQSNGTANEVVEGVERFDIRYSLVDHDGRSYWLSASELGGAITEDGIALVCVRDGKPARPCGGRDVDAIDIAMLLNTVNDVESATTQDETYRYSVNGDEALTPSGAMPATGLRPWRMLRREFRATFSLDVSRS